MNTWIQKISRRKQWRPTCTAQKLRGFIMAQKFPGGISWAQNGEKGGEFHFLYSQREQEFLKFLFLPQRQIFIRSGSNLRRLIHVNLYVKYFRTILMTTLIQREFEKKKHSFARPLWNELYCCILLIPGLGKGLGLVDPAKESRFLAGFPVNFKIRVRGRGTGSGTRRETQIKIIEILFVDCPFKDFCTLVFLSFFGWAGFITLARNRNHTLSPFPGWISKGRVGNFYNTKTENTKLTTFFPCQNQNLIEKSCVTKRSIDHVRSRE